jgi:tetratricopeptide (TPR) repeat protein
MPDTKLQKETDMVEMLTGILSNLLTSLLEFGIGKIIDKETTLKLLSRINCQPLKDSFERCYVLSVVRFWEIGKPKSILEFLRDKEVIVLIKQRVNNSVSQVAFEASISILIDSLAVGDAMKTDQLDPILQVNSFIAEYEAITRNVIPPSLAMVWHSINAQIEGISSQSHLEHDLLKAQNNEILDRVSSIPDIAVQLNALQAELSRFNLSSIPLIDTEHNAELDIARDFLRDGKPADALRILEQFRSRNWNQSTPMIRFRLLTNIANAKHMLSFDKDSAPLFIEALQFNPTDEKALANCAFGYFLLSDFASSSDYVLKTLRLNSLNELALALKIRIRNRTASLEEVLKEIPTSEYEKADVAYALTDAALNANDLEKAEYWIRIAVKAAKPVCPDLNASQASIIIQSVIGKFGDLLFHSDISRTLQERLSEATILINSAWNSIDNSLKPSRSGWLYNSSLAKRILGEINGAVIDINTALSNCPTNKEYLRMKAILCCDATDYSTAIDILTEQLTDSDFPERVLLLAECYSLNQQSEASIKVLEDAISTNQPEKVFKSCCKFLISLYIGEKKLENCQVLVDRLLASYPEHALSLILLAYVKNLTGEKQIALNLASDAFRNIDSCKSLFDFKTLADNLFDLELFDFASKVYSRFVKPELQSPLTRRLAFALYYSGDMQETIRFCNSVISFFPRTKFATDILASVFEEIHDYDRARSVCEDYFRIVPEDIDISFRLAHINFKSNHFTDLDNFLSHVDADKLSIHQSINLSFLFAFRERFLDGLNVLYELRRKRFGDSIPHLKYFGYFHQFSPNLDSILCPSEVVRDTAVVIKIQDRSFQHYIIENRTDADLSKHEINTTHRIAKELIGKKCGDFVKLTTSDYYDGEKGEIVEIISKYVFALREVQENYEALFPDNPGIWKIRVDPSDVKSILSLVDKTQQSKPKFEEIYNNYKLPIGTIAALLHTSPVMVWNTVLGTSALRFYSAIGNIALYNEAVDCLSGANLRIVMDITSLLSVHGANMSTFLKKAFQNLIVTHSTVDIIKDVIAEQRTLLSRGSLSIGKEGNQYIKHQRTPEDVEATVIYYEGMINWIRSNCQVIPCQEALSINRNERLKLCEVHGESFVDTMLVSARDNTLLFSDDLFFRQIASQYGVRCVWFQAILRHLLNVNVIDNTAYMDTVVRLCEMKYNHTFITADIIMHAARQDNWAPSYIFNAVSSCLKGDRCDSISAIRVCTETLRKIFLEPMPQMNREFLTIALLESITTLRRRESVISDLLAAINQQFFLLPIASDNVKKLIQAWSTSQIV